MGLSALTDRQRRLVESLPAKLRNAMLGKEAVMWFDKERTVTLLFLLVDESRLVEGAWEYYCDGCYSLSKGSPFVLPTGVANDSLEERRVIVRGGRFLRFDPRQPEDREHTCAASKQTARTSSGGMQEHKPTAISAQVPAPRPVLINNYGPVIKKSKSHISYRSRLYSNRK